MLAQVSTSLVSSKAGSDAVAANPKLRRTVSMYGGAVYGGDPYGGSMYGDPFGGTSYARWTAPVWSYASAMRPPHYVVTDTGLDASIEGGVVSEDELRGVALMNLGIVETWTGRLAEAERPLDEGAALARAIGRPYLEVVCRAHQGFPSRAVSVLRTRA